MKSCAQILKKQFLEVAVNLTPHLPDGAFFFVTNPVFLHILPRAPFAQKGAIELSATGYIQVRAYTSYAQYPLQDVAIAVTDSEGTAIAMRLTDRNGLIEPIEIPVPNKSESLAPDPGEKPYTTVNLYARKQGYEQVEAENLQVFAETTTLQNLEMIPLSELPGSWDQTVIYDTPPQNL